MSPINTASGQERRTHEQAREVAGNPERVVDRGNLRQIAL